MLDRNQSTRAFNFSGVPQSSRATGPSSARPPGFRASSTASSSLRTCSSRSSWQAASVFVLQRAQRIIFFKIWVAQSVALCDRTRVNICMKFEKWHFQFFCWVSCVHMRPMKMPGFSIGGSSKILKRLESTADKFLIFFKTHSSHVESLGS